MLEAIKYNLANLTNLNGRDARQTFWYYVLFLVLVQFAVSLAASIPMYADMFGEAFRAAEAGSDPEEMRAAMFAGMAGQLKVQMTISAVVSILMVGFLLAAFVRRLHDSGKPGWIAAIPATTHIFAAIYSYANLENMLAAMQTAMSASNPEETIAMQGQVAGWSMVSWVGILIAIIFGVMKSQDGPNQYGDEPVRF